MFRRKQQPEPAAPEATLEERYEANLREIAAADAEIKTRDAALKAFALENDLILDSWGFLQKCKAIGGAKRNDLQQQARALYVARGEAGQRFYTLLNIHAGLKEAINATSNCSTAVGN